MSALAKFNRIIISILLSISIFYGGYYYGKRGYEFEVKKNPPKVTVINKSPADQTIDFAIFWEVWDTLSTQYLERPVDAQKMFYGAVSGMVEAVGDPYTAYLPPELNTAVNDSLNSVYEGIGAELGLEDGQLIVVAPLDGSPAKASGIRAGDKITKIDGESTFGITITEAVFTIRGEAGTDVVLTVVHDGNSEETDITITRDRIKVDSVRWEDKGEGTAYIRISRFGDTTNKEWDNVVDEILSDMSELDAIIIDVRGNPGGYLHSAAHIASTFVGDKPALVHQTSTGKETKIQGDTKKAEFSGVPGIFILIDEGSASSSEILAGALKAYTDAVTIGETSFGKGTIQDVVEYDDGSSLHITTAKWLTPDKMWVHDTGIEPDVEVELTSEDINNGDDPQLDKAIELSKEI